MICAGLIALAAVASAAREPNAGVPENPRILQCYDRPLGVGKTGGATRTCWFEAGAEWFLAMEPDSQRL